MVSHKKISRSVERTLNSSPITGIYHYKLIKNNDGTYEFIGEKYGSVMVYVSGVLCIGAFLALTVFVFGNSGDRLFGGTKTTEDVLLMLGFYIFLSSLLIAWPIFLYKIINKAKTTARVINTKEKTLSQKNGKKSIRFSDIVGVQTREVFYRIHHSLRVDRTEINLIHTDYSRTTIAGYADIQNLDKDIQTLLKILDIPLILRHSQ